MRLRALALVMIVGLAIPLVGGDGSAPSSSVGLEATDPAGDLESETGFVFPPYDFIDLTQLDIDVSDVISIKISVAGTEGLPLLTAAGGGGIPATILVSMEYRGQIFELVFRVNDSQGDVLVMLLSEGRNLYMDEIRYVDDSLTASIPISLFETDDGFSPSSGEPIHLEFWGSAWTGQAGPDPRGHEGTPAIYDRVNVDEVPAIILPGAGLGLSVTSPAPVARANGDEAVYGWTLEATNHRNEGRTLAIEIEADPELEVFIPGIIDIDPSESVTFRVYAVASFAHAHGDTRSVEITLSDRLDRLAYSLEVHYIHPPQPAGHHNKVYFHVNGTAGPLGYDPVWMNTLEPQASESAGGARPVDCHGYSFEGGWLFALDPGMEVGIDGEVGAMAHMSGRITQHAALPNMEIAARIVLVEAGRSEYPIDEWTAVASWPGAGTHAWELEVPMPPELDYVEPLPGRNLGILIRLCPTDTTPYTYPVADKILDFEPGGQAVLPFNDFRPRMTSTSGLHFDTPSSVVRAPPGGFAVWAVNVTGTGSAQADVTLLAPEAFDAAIVEDGGDPRRLVVQIGVPESAAEGAILDALLVAPGTELRLGVIVDQDAPGSPKYASAPAEKSIPFPALLWIGGLMMIASRRLR